MDTIAITLAGIFSFIRVPIYLKFHRLVPTISLKEVIHFFNKSKNHHLIFVIFDLRHTTSWKLNCMNYLIMILVLLSLLFHFI